MGGRPHLDAGFVVATSVETDSPMVFQAGRFPSEAVRLCLAGMDTSLSRWDRMRGVHRSVKASHLRDRNSVRDLYRCDCNWGSVSSVRLGSIQTFGSVAFNLARTFGKRNMKCQKH